MRLEIEPNVASPQFSPYQAADEVIGSEKIDIGQLLSHGITAARNGDRILARTQLLNVTEADPGNVDAWLWLASISEYPEELLGFLSRVLEIDPSNTRACQWEVATRSLLAKMFVQRGITANTDGHPDFAVQCFDRALEYDEKCESAWFWKSSLVTTDDEREMYLEHVLEIDPNDNEAARVLRSIPEDKSPAKLVRARIAAFSGNTMGAEEIVDEVIAREPENIDAWSLRSQLALTFEEKLEAYERVFELDPENALARAGAHFLSAARNVACSAESAPVAESVPVEPVQPKQLAVEPIQAAAEAVAEQRTEFAPVNLTPDHTPIALKFDDAIAGTDLDQHLHEYPTQDSFALTDSFSSYGSEAVSEPEPVQMINDRIDDPQPVAPFVEDAPAEEEQYWIHDTVPADRTDSAPFEFDQVNSALASYNPFEQKFDKVPLAEAEPLIADSEMKAFKPMTTANLSTSPVVSMVKCAFCGAENEPQSFDCGTCRAHLSLSDIDSLFGESHVNTKTIQDAVTRMEAEWNFREFSESELTMLGLGHINLRDFDKGIAYIQEASRLNPNDVILASRANEMVIRLEDLRRQDENHESMPKGKTILVVDDSATVRKLISSKLEKCGHHVLTAVDGVEAIEVIESAVPDLVLLDIAMPRMDGYAVCKLIRARESFKDVPVVMISGKDGFFDKVRGRMAGTTGYITKPFGPETLMRALETYLLPDETSE